MKKSENESQQARINASKERGGWKDYLMKLVDIKESIRAYYQAEVSIDKVFKARHSTNETLQGSF